MPLSKNKKQTLLVTGGAGFMGSDFVRYMLSKKTTGKVVVFDKLNFESNKDNLTEVAKDKRYHFVKGDICNAKQIENIIKKYRPTHIVNFAAETHVDRSIHGQAQDFLMNNIFGIHTLLEATNKHTFIQRLVHISTDEVYGDTSFTSKERFTETSSLRPSNPYSASKAAGDMLALSYHRTYGTSVVITRSGNNYGPYQHPEKLIPHTIFLAQANKKVPVYGKGKNIRNWVYVRDHSRAVETAMLKGEDGQVYNISADEYHANIDVVKTILDTLKKDHKLITFVKDRPGHDRRYAPEAKKLRRLGWKPQQPFAQGLTKTAKWYQDNPKWVSRVQKKLKDINKHIRV